MQRSEKVEDVIEIGEDETVTTKSQRQDVSSEFFYMTQNTCDLFEKYFFYKKCLFFQPEAPIPLDERDPKRHYCSKCPRSYTRSNDLKKHQKKCIEGIETNFPCQWENCRKSFMTSQTLKEHVAADHMHLPIVTCGCGKEFRHISHFSIHQCDQKKGKKKTDVSW